MKKIVIVCLCILVAVSFSSFLGLFGNSPSPKRKMACKISNDLSKIFKKKYGLNFMGISEAAENGKYKIIGLELYSDKILSKDEGRRLLVNCALDAIKAFNSYPQFQEYMVNYPFSGKNLIIHIYVQPNNWDVFYPDIDVFLFYNDVLTYKTTSPQNRNVYYTEEKEALEEAMRIVSLQHANSQLQE